MNKTFNLLLLLISVYLTSCKKSDSLSNSNQATIVYNTTISSIVTYKAYYYAANGQSTYYYFEPILGNTWTQFITVKRDSFKTAAMEMIINGTPPIQAKSQIFVNGVLKESLNSSFNKSIDTIYLEDANIWSN